MNRFLFKQLLIPFLFLFYFGEGHSHDNARVHPRITRLGANLFHEKDPERKYWEVYRPEYVGLDHNIGFSEDGEALSEYAVQAYQGQPPSLISGSVLEDHPVENVFNHFYHAISGKKMFIDNKLAQLFISEREKILAELKESLTFTNAILVYGAIYLLEKFKPTLDAIENNKDSFTYAREHWKTAIEKYNEGDLSQAYFYLGRVVHLVEDLSSPAHVHNDLHLTLFDQLLEESDPYEGKHVPRQLSNLLPPVGLDFKRYNIPEIKKLSDIWGKEKETFSGRTYRTAAFPGQLDRFSEEASGRISEMFDFKFTPIEQENGPDLPLWEINNNGRRFFYFGKDKSAFLRTGELSLAEVTDDWWETSDLGGFQNHYYFEKTLDLKPEVFYEYNPKNDSYNRRDQSEPKKSMAEFYAERLLQPAVEYAAGVMKHFYEVVNRPPYVESVTVWQRLPGESGESHVLYEALWEKIPQSQKRRLIMTSQEVILRNEDNLFFEVELVFSEEMNEESLTVQLGNHVVQPFGVGYKRATRSWKGVIEVFPKNELNRVNHLIVNGKSLYPYLDFETMEIKEGRELDADPATLPQLSVSFEERLEHYEWEFYEGGGDQVHTPLQPVIAANVLIGDFETAPISVGIPAGGDGKVAEEAIRNEEGSPVSGEPVIDMVIAPDNLRAFTLSKEKLNVFAVNEIKKGTATLKTLVSLPNIDIPFNLEGDAFLTSLAVTPDASRVYVSDSVGGIHVVNIKKLTLYNTATQKGEVHDAFTWIQKFYIHPHAVTQLEVSPDGRQLYFLVEGPAGQPDEPKRLSKAEVGLLGAINIELLMNAPSQGEGKAKVAFHDVVYTLELTLPESERKGGASFLSPYAMAIAPDGNYALVTAEGRRIKPLGTPFGHVPANDDLTGGVLVVDLKSGTKNEERLLQHIPTVLQAEATRDILNQIIEEHQQEHPLTSFYGGLVNASIHRVEADLNTSLWSAYRDMFSHFGLAQGYAEHYGIRMVGASDVAFTPEGDLALVTLKDTNNVGFLNLESGDPLLGVGPEEKSDFYFSGVTEQNIDFFTPDHGAIGIADPFDTYDPTDWDRFGPETIAVTGDGRYAFIGAGRGGAWKDIWLGNRFGFLDIAKAREAFLENEAPDAKALSRDRFPKCSDEAQIKNLNFRDASVVAPLFPSPILI